MVEYIKEALICADDYTVEQIYEFILNEENWKEVIQCLIWVTEGSTENKTKISHRREWTPSGTLDLPGQII